MLCDDLSQHVEDAYVMGHRLLSFLQTALPQHPEYRPNGPAGRQCQADAAWLRSKLNDIALLIDEVQLNLFMDQDFVPVQDDDDEDEDDPGGWEKFSDWAFKDDAPRLVDTDTSDVDLQASSESEAENDEPNRGPLQFRFDIEKDDSYEVHKLNSPVMATTFLKQIANEDVHYETDSEAADSWAQDGNSAACSGTSSGTALTCDPARIAFREIMNKLPGALRSAGGDLGSAAPTTATTNESGRRWQLGRRDEEHSRDEWASFDNLNDRGEL
jgi:hypothetical protein